jgi:hypothetical protein
MLSFLWVLFEKGNQPFAFLNRMNDDDQPEQMRDYMMNVHRPAVDTGNENHHANGHQDKCKHGKKRYFVPSHHFTSEHRFGQAPVLPDVNKYQRIPRHACDAVERTPRVCRKAVGGGKIRDKKTNDQQDIHYCLCRFIYKNLFHHDT